MAAPMLLRVALLRVRLLHQQRPTAKLVSVPCRLWCSTAAASESGHPQKEEADATHAVNRAALFSAREPSKLTRMDDPDYRKWKDKENEILRDIEPIILLTKDILHSQRYMDGEQLTPEDEKAVVEKLLAYHPRSEDKIGCGLDCIMVDRHPQFRHSRCLFVVRTDGRWIDFSYQKCLRAYIRDKYRSYAERFISEHFKRGSR